jgi:CubicO group peptidase (beta-lactamase class C family)
MYSTIGDLLKWEHGLFGGKVLSANSLKLMTTPGKGNYGLGLMTAEKHGMKVVEHGGAITGFTSFASYLPERGVAVVVLTNVFNLTTPVIMADQLLDVALGKSVMLSSERKPVPITQAALARFVGVYDVSPTYSLTINRARDRLIAEGTNLSPLDMTYLGEQRGHPCFFVPLLSDPRSLLPVLTNAEIEFVPDSNGLFSSLIVHAEGQNILAERR